MSVHHVYVVGGCAEEAEAFIRRQNDVRFWPKRTEFITVTRPEQIEGLVGQHIVTLPGFCDRKDCDLMAQLILAGGGPWQSH